MKRIKYFFVVLLILVFTLALSAVAFAGNQGSNNNGDNNGNKAEQSVKAEEKANDKAQKSEEKASGQAQKSEEKAAQQTQKSEEKAAQQTQKTEEKAQKALTNEEQDEEEDADDDDAEQAKAWVAEKNRIEQEKDAIESMKDQLEAEKEALELQYEEAEANGDEALMASIQERIKELDEEINAYRVEIRAKIELMQQVMKKQYTEEELAEMEILSLQVQNRRGYKALPVQNILVAGGNVKFDTPPVIKDDVVLIPVRAVSETLGAIVSWDRETQTVTIANEETKIVLDLANEKVFVNGVETDVDLPPEIMNKRTVVPLSFIKEVLGLETTWDEETETVELILGEA